MKLKKLKNSTWLITGGAGFIGSALASHLIEMNINVVIIDNFNDYYDPKIKYNRAKKLEQAGCNIVEGDIRDNKALEHIFNEYPLSGMVHLAAMAGVRPSIENPLLYTDVNVNGTHTFI